LRAVDTRQLARIFQSDVGVAPDHLLVVSSAEAIAEHSRGVAQLGTGRRGDERQSVAQASIDWPGAESSPQSAVGSNLLKPSHGAASSPIRGVKIGPPDAVG